MDFCRGFGGQGMQVIFWSSFFLLRMHLVYCSDGAAAATAAAIVTATATSRDMWKQRRRWNLGDIGRYRRRRKEAMLRLKLESNNSRGKRIQKERVQNIKEAFCLPPRPILVKCPNRFDLFILGGVLTYLLLQLLHVACRRVDPILP